MDNKQESINRSLECKSTFSLDCDSLSQERLDSDSSSDDEYYTQSRSTLRSIDTEYDGFSDDEYSQSQEIKRSQSQDISSDDSDSDPEEYYSLGKRLYYSSDSESEADPVIIATDEDGIETTFENLYHASRSLGISIEYITKCCKNIRGYEDIIVNDGKKYRFMFK